MMMMMKMMIGGGGEPGAWQHSYSIQSSSYYWPFG